MKVFVISLLQSEARDLTRRALFNRGTFPRL
jgi:hypothetical protein